jgi:hypothetical protein
MSKKSTSQSETVTIKTDATPFIVKYKTASIIIIAVLLVIISSLTWIRQVYYSPERVFNAMLENNLSTNGVTRTRIQEQQAGKKEDIEQVSFVPEAAVRTLQTIDQKTPDGNNKVVTQSIGTLTNDYSEFISIDVSQKDAKGKKLNYASVEKQWGKTDPKEQPAQIFRSTVLSPIPFANLDQGARTKIIDLMKQSKAYDVQYSRVKTVKVDGTEALAFPVKINSEKYVTVLKQLATFIGVNNTDDLKPEDFKDQPPIEVTIAVGKLSRQILEVTYAGGQKETYSAYGMVEPIKIPQSTISLNELRQKAESIQ